MDEQQKLQEITSPEALAELVNRTPEGTMITVELDEREAKDDGDDI